MELTFTQQRICDGLRQDPGEFGDDTDGLDITALGAYSWLRCVLASVSAHHMTTRWPNRPTASERANALNAAKRALVNRYAPGGQWL